MTGHERSVAARLRHVVVAGHRRDAAGALAHVDDEADEVRAAALGALDRCGELTDDALVAAFGDTSPVVRRRAVELAASRPEVRLTTPLEDGDPSVVELAAWACGEHEQVSDVELQLLVALATDADDALVRESAAAALGAIGDERGLPAILAACTDKPNVRRRAVLALAPFEGAEVESAIDRALGDRDWQVRQAAEDLRRAAGDAEP